MNREELKAITVAEVRAKRAQYAAEDTALVKEQIALEGKPFGIPTPISSGPEGDFEKEVRAHQKDLANGFASLLLRDMPDLDRLRSIKARREAIRRDLPKLQRLEEDVLFAESEARTNERAEAWRALSRERILGAVRLEVLEKRAAAMVADLVVGTYPPDHIGRYEETLFEMLAAGRLDVAIRNAIASGIINETDVRKAQNAKSG